MNGAGLKLARQRGGWTQQTAARRLGVSQPYLAMLEAGKRRLTLSLAQKLHRVYGLAPTVLPPTAPLTGQRSPDNQALAEELAKLGYPGFAYLRPRRPAKNPAEVLLLALAQDDLEPRLTAALPWLLLCYGDTLDRKWLVEQVKLRDLQNRLGFVVSLARRKAENNPRFKNQAAALAELEQQLERSRLAREDTLCEAPCQRPSAAGWFRTDPRRRPEHLRYAA